MLTDLDGLGIERILCLGDVVGYGADPGPVVDVMGDCGALGVAGNHDHAVAGRLDLDWFNPYARRAVEWTAEQLRADQTAYLATLPLVTEHEGATLVHASPRNPAAWPYLVAPADGEAALAEFATELCFVGHSHLPAVWTLTEDGRVDFHRGAGRTGLSPGARYLINVGSVGQPRDGRPEAAYAVWDLQACVVEIRRVLYDAHEARRRIHAAGLPRVLGDRLLVGR